MRARLAAALARHGRLVYSNSLGAEAMVLTDIIWTHLPQIDMFSIDTGRLHEETYGLLQKLQQRYSRKIRVVYPDAGRSSNWSAQQGINGFYENLAARLECCRIRKVEPFRRAVRDYPAWITGVRREQSQERALGQPKRGTPSTDCTSSARSSTGTRRRCGSTSAPLAAVQCAARPSVSEHRLRALHARHPAGRKPARGSLVVGAT